MFPAVDRVLGRELNNGFIDPCDDTAYFNFNLENITDSPDDIDSDDFADLTVVELENEVDQWSFCTGYDN